MAALLRWFGAGGKLSSLLDGGDATPLELCRSEHIALQDTTWDRAVRTRAYNHFTHPFREST